MDGIVTRKSETPERWDGEYNNSHFQKSLSFQCPK